MCLNNSIRLLFYRHSTASGVKSGTSLISSSETGNKPYTWGWIEPELSDDEFPFRLVLEQLNNRHRPARGRTICAFKILVFLMCNVLAKVKKAATTSRILNYIKALKKPRFFCRPRAIEYFSIIYYLCERPDANERITFP